MTTGSRASHNEFDCTPSAFADVLDSLPKRLPISDAFDLERSPEWELDHREMWVGWLREYEGPGAYDRVTRGGTAKDSWNHMQNPPAMVWAAEAVGVDKESIREAIDAANAKESEGGNLSSQGAAVRRVLPWKLIGSHVAAHLRAHEPDRV